MSTRHVDASKMAVGSKGGGKHWTAAEVQARKDAAELVKRKNAVRLKAPGWLSVEGLVIWKRIVKQLRGMELLDNLDENMLAVYCDCYSKYKSLTVQPMLEIDDIKNLQAWARLLAGYAEKLGLTPTGRARLAKKAADKTLDEFGGEFD